MQIPPEAVCTRRRSALALALMIVMPLPSAGALAGSMPAGATAADASGIPLQALARELSLALDSQVGMPHWRTALLQSMPDTLNPVSAQALLQSLYKADLDAILDMNAMERQSRFEAAHAAALQSNQLHVVNGWLLSDSEYLAIRIIATVETQA